MELQQLFCDCRVKLFGKLLIVMGIPFIFEFISALAEGSGYVDAAWYWIVFNVLSMFQGVYIFFIFVFKEDVRRQLAEDYSFCQCKLTVAVNV